MYFSISRQNSSMEGDEGSIFSDWGNNTPFWEELEDSKLLGNRFGLFQIQLGGLRGKFCNFCGHLSF